VKILSNWKRTLKRVGLGLLAVVAIGLLVNSILSWRAGARLEAKLERLREEGAPTSTSELPTLEAPSDENAAAAIHDAASLINAFGKDNAQYRATESGKAYLDRVSKGDLPTQEQVRELEAILDRHPEALKAALEASQRESYVPMIDGGDGQRPYSTEDLEWLSTNRSVARLLNKKIHVAAVNGRLDEAVATGTDLLRLSRFYEREPGVVGYLVAFAVRRIAINSLNQVVRQQGVSSEMRDRLNAALARQTGLAGLRASLETERAIGLDAIAEMRNRLPMNLGGWYFTDRQAELIDLYDEILPPLSKPWHRDRPRLVQSQEDYSFLNRSVLPAIRNAVTAAHKDLAAQRCLRILNELKRYEVEHNRPPSGLDDLGIDEQQLIDPFSGDPLLVKKSEAGWIVYSVSVNGADDGGEVRGDTTDPPDWGLAP